MPKSARPKGRVIKSARGNNKKYYIILTAVAIAIVAGFAGWYSYSSAHNVTTSINSSTNTIGSTAGLAFVKITTHFGNIEVELFQNDTPKTVANFLSLVNQGFYNGLVFHRIVKGFVIQTGDPTSKGGAGDPCTWGSQGSPNNIPLEIAPSLHNYVGYLGMARGSSNNSATSQFYINLVNNTSLDGRYAVFGKVISGLTAVQDIGNLPINPNCAGQPNPDPPQNPSDAMITQIVVE